jgi:hypothetical protein
MNSKLLVAGLVSGVAGFLLGWLVYGMLLMDFMAAHTTVYAGLMKEPPFVPGIFISNLCWGLLFAYIFQKWANITDFGGGFSAGLIITFLMSLSIDVFQFSFMNLGDTTMYAVDVVVGTLMGGVMGGAAGMVLGKGKA